MPFVKGKSGNPSGRPKVTTALAERAREYTSKALNVLVEALKDPDKKIRLLAANSLLDRGYGRPGQPITGPEGEPAAISVVIDLGSSKD